jgi:predicted RNase H-like nuclease (RuvC/YqgF family)
MTIHKGGRGKKAPYETTQMRVPVPIKDQVNSLIAKFRGEVLDDSKTGENLFESVENSQLSLELDSLQSELQNLKRALEISEIEKLNLKIALEATNQQADNLSSALVDARSEIQNLSASLEEEKQKSTNLNTGKVNTFDIGDTIGEGEALEHYRIGRNILRRPREKGKTTVSFTTNDISVTLEYLGQPEGKGKQHFWKIVDQTNQLSIS